MLSLYLYSKDSCCEETRKEKEPFPQLAEEQEVEERRLSHCLGNLTLAIDPMASLNFPGRSYTAEFLVCNIAPEHIQAVSFTVH